MLGALLGVIAVLFLLGRNSPAPGPLGPSSAPRAVPSTSPRPRAVARAPVEDPAAVPANDPQPVVQLSDVAAEPFSRLIGRVVESGSGVPIPDATVSVLPAGSDWIPPNRILGMARTGSDGTFEVHVRRGTGDPALDVVAGRPGFIRSGISGTRLVGPATPVGDIALASAVPITGHVVTPAGEPVSDVEVVAVPVATRGNERGWTSSSHPRGTDPAVPGLDISVGGSTRTGEAGRFVIPGLERSATYELRVVATNSAQAIVAARDVIAPAEGVRLEVRGLACVAIRLAGAATVAGWTLMAINEANVTAEIRALTNETSDRALWLDPGEWRIRLASSGLNFEFDSGSLSLAPGDRHALSWAVPPSPDVRSVRVSPPSQADGEWLVVFYPAQAAAQPTGALAVRWQDGVGLVGEVPLVAGHLLLVHVAGAVTGYVSELGAGKSGETEVAKVKLVSLGRADIVVRSSTRHLVEILAGPAPVPHVVELAPGFLTCVGPSGFYVTGPGRSVVSGLPPGAYLVRIDRRPPVALQVSPDTPAQVEIP